MFMYDIESFDICLDIEVNRKKKKKKGVGKFLFFIIFLFYRRKPKNIIKEDRLCQLQKT